ncbi:hypothetical protein, partial [Kutzneria sp. NPDC051319]|uniref:hypothetical protein n=1 Tax=Kutzneria sp. NPDC051319 TaxID=3155047 RepID=UPI003444D910
MSDDQHRSRNEVFGFQFTRRCNHEGRAFPDEQDLGAQARQLLSELGISVDPRRALRTLGLGVQQMI